jgi:predicted Zn-dependent peptidase
VIVYNRFTLKNGLRVVHQFDPTESNVVLNTLYNVGARDEDSNRTGFAHLFEHLMFGGSENVPSFDEAIENAGGQNNAFTTNEITNYYINVPLENIETAFWLESDRMLALNINEKSLSVQQGVVIEEFKQRCYNAPFGQLWHHIRNLLYTNSPYRWPTIGQEILHVETANLQDVQSFYNKHYIPQNAIVSIVGNLSLEETKALCENGLKT